MGRIITKNSKGYAWIDRKSVTEIDGSPADLATDKDIYLHGTDSGPWLKVGLELTFEIVPDTKRASGLRAIDARFVRRRALGIDLHVDATRVDNPAVPMRWCFTPEVHKRITDGLRLGYGYAVVLIGGRRDDDYGFRQERAVFGWKQPFTFFSFMAEGDWSVCALLYERTMVSTTYRSTSSLLEVDLRSKLLSKERFMRRKQFDFHVPDLEELHYLENPGHLEPRQWSEYGIPIAAHTINVSLPKEIFAPEPSEAVKAYGNYFFRQQPEDQCEFRQRLMLMTPGVIPWFIIEGLKRLSFLIASALYLLFFYPDTLNTFKHVFKPAINLEMPVEKEYDTENGMMWPFNKRPLGWFVPGMLLVYASGIWISIKIVLPILVKIVSWLIGIVAANWVAVLFVLGLSVLIFGAVAFMHYLIAKFEKPESRDERHKAQQVRTAKKKATAIVLGEQEASVAEAFASALVCGDVPSEVTLKAIPRELRTRHMLFASLKQRVCRPFAR